jgi:RNA polymerase-binding transcription factor DksA
MYGHIKKELLLRRNHYLHLQETAAAQPTDNYLQWRTDLLREKKLAMIEEALVRLDHGTYGRCHHCGRAIHAKRLAQLPYAIYCLTCQIRQEGSKTR